MIEIGKSPLDRDAQVLIGLSCKTAFKLGVHDREWGAQIMRYVFPDALQLIKKPDDLVKHEIDRACHIVEIIHPAVRRQSFLKIALHDTDNCLVDRLEPTGAAQAEYCPGGEREKDGGHDANHKSLEDDLPERIDFVKTPAKQHDAAILSLPGDEDHGFSSRIGTMKLPRLDDVGLAIDRQALRYRYDIAVLERAALVEQRRIIEPAQISL